MEVFRVRPIKRLELERTSLRIGQRQVETATGVPQPVISLAENGRLIPTTKQLQALADFFRVPADDLLKDVVVLGSRR
jgi:transcriptional regulator with XRE-family HTH domain